MRSKPKARKLTQDEPEDNYEQFDDNHDSESDSLEVTEPSPSPAHRLSILGLHENQLRGHLHHRDQPSDRPRGDQPYGDQPYVDQPYGETGPPLVNHSDQPYGDQPYVDQPYGETGPPLVNHRDQPYGDQPYGDSGPPLANHRDQSYEHQPYGDTRPPLANPRDQPYGHIQPPLANHRDQPYTDTRPPLASPRDHPPVYIPEDIPIPEEFELRESSVMDSLGVWTKVIIPDGRKFGPFQGVLKPIVADPSSAWELVDDFGKVKGWIDASEQGAGNWMKYIRSSQEPAQQNVMAVQVQDQVYYKSVRDLQPGEEMLLYARDAVYPEKDLDCIKNYVEEERQYPCGKCGEVFRSKVALRRHETYVCNNSNAIFSQLNRDFLESTSQQAAENNPEKKGDSAHGGEMIQEARHSADNSRDSSIIDNEEERSEGGSSVTGLKQFPCENCDKVFSDPSNLQRHIRSTHVGARSHACHECGKTFATSSGLKQHQHIHSSVKPFQCEVCLKAYTQFSNLCRHKRMHADCRQQIKCKDCGQAFSTMTSLSKHKRFCEGMLRNGARFSFPTAGPQSPEKTQPTNPVVSQASALTAAYMNFYGPRPQFPFYPPLGPGFPMFPPGHPLAAMTHQVLPEAKFPPTMTPTSSKSPRAELSPCTAPSPRAPSPAKTGEKHRLHMDGSEGSDLSDVSTAHSVSVASDVDTEGGSDLESDSGYERSSIIQKKPFHNIHPMSHISPGITSPAKTSTPIYDLKRMKRERLESDAKRVKREELPFDLSKSTSSSTGDQPLDLSVSKKSRESPIPETTPRKTHIFGSEVVKKPSPPTPPTEMESPEQKSPLHYAYPLANPMLMEQMYRLDKDKLRTFQEAARMMAMGPAARFPMHSSPYGAMPGMPGMMRSPMALDPTKALMNPLLKLDRTPDYPYGGQKIKDRYACKFCGKIFPRSANLTRHLRTHTGEQPYKCKYCERSFSISSNLQRHVRNIHNKEKPFKCPLCDRCFGQQTNLDRHLKKHETEGPNVIDSPTNQEADLEDKDESYFDEIRNFIGKATKSDHDERSVSPRREYDHIDANFSITAQIEKQNKMSSEKQLEKFDDSFDDDHHEDEEENDSVDVEGVKKDKPDNNNSNGEMMDLPNGYHSNEEDVISKHASHPLSLAITS